MPGLGVSSKSPELRQNNNGIPFLNVPYDGHPDPGREEWLGVFMYQVEQRMGKG